VKPISTQPILSGRRIGINLGSPKIIIPAARMASVNIFTSSAESTETAK
jgi:hypothetical protein